MHSIEINRSVDDEIQRELAVHEVNRMAEVNKIRRNGFILLAISVVLFFVSFINDFSYFQLIVIGLIWMIFGIDVVMRMLQYERLMKVKRTHVMKNFNEQEMMVLEFDDKEVKVLQKSTNEVLQKQWWQNFKYYYLANEAIYLFEDRIVIKWSFTQQEIGTEAFNAISKIAGEKMKLITVRQTK